MDVNRLTERVQEALGAAQTKAVRFGHQQVDVEHLLLALLEQGGQPGSGGPGLATSILNKAEVDVDGLRRRVEQELERLPKVSGPGSGSGQISITGRLNRLLVQAEDEA